MRYIALILVIALVVTLVGCGKLVDTQPSGDQSVNSPAVEPVDTEIIEQVNADLVDESDDVEIGEMF